MIILRCLKTSKIKRENVFLSVRVYQPLPYPVRACIKEHQAPKVWFQPDYIWMEKGRRIKQSIVTQSANVTGQDVSAPNSKKNVQYKYAKGSMGIVWEQYHGKSLNILEYEPWTSNQMRWDLWYWGQKCSEAATKTF